MLNQATSIASKWLKTQVLMQDERVNPHIPETRKYSQENLRIMLSGSGLVVLKPNIGTGGSGLMLIERQNESYLIKHKSRQRRFTSFPALLGALKKLMGRRQFLVQQGIRLAQINGRPLDYRVKIAKKGQRWVTRSVVGRLAREGLFVTNLCSGGTLLTSSEAIRRSLPELNAAAKKQEMRKLAYLCKDIFIRQYPLVEQLGFDFGLDGQGKIWIFELNTKPH